MEYGRVEEDEIKIDEEGSQWVTQLILADEKERKIKAAFDLTHPFGRKSTKEDFQNFFEVESNYIAVHAYGLDDLASSQRKNAIAIIQQYQKQYDTEFLAVTYLDHYLSRNRPPLFKKPDSEPLRFLATTCILLALSLTSACFKLDTFKVEVETVLAFEDNSKVVKEAKWNKIWQVGFMIMIELKCKLRAVTPFCFIGYFVSLLEIEDIDAASVVDILNRMHFESEYIQCTRFKPSVKAGCAILAALSCTTDPQEYQTRIARSDFIQEEHLLECIALTASLRKRHARGIALLEEHFVIKKNPDAPRPPADVMELITNAGGVEVKLVIEKDLLANDLSNNCNRFAIPVDKVTEPGFLTDQEAEESSLVIGTGRQLIKGIENVPLLQPNRETIHVTLKYWKPNHYVLCNTWGKVCKNGTNQLAKGTKVQLWSYRVSGKLHLALIRIPQGQQ